MNHDSDYCTVQCKTWLGEKELVLKGQDRLNTKAGDSRGNSYYENRSMSRRSQKGIPRNEYVKAPETVGNVLELRERALIPRKEAQK